ncbi:MAG: acyl-CoA-binding protein, partial [Arenimonas sp.]
PTPAPAAAPATGGDLVARFEAAAERVATAPAGGTLKPSNEMKLRMYALYRQANDGDVQGKRPGMMDIVGRLKYDAWAELKGTAREDAMRRYADQVESIERKFAGTAQKQA